MACRWISQKVFFQSVEKSIDKDRKLTVEEILSQAFALGQGLDGLRQGGNAGFGRGKGTSVRPARLFAHLA